MTGSRRYRERRFKHLRPTAHDPFEAYADLTQGPLLAAVRNLADLHGWLHFHAPGCEHADRSEPGFPDVVLVRPPRLLAVEIKRPLPDKPTPEQATWLRALDGVRVGEALVLRPGPALDDLEDLLR